MKKLEKLEKLLTDYVARIHELQAEKTRLDGEVKSLKNEIKSIVSQYEKTNHKMESDKTVIRAKIKNILNNLEQIDFI